MKFIAYILLIIFFYGCAANNETINIKAKSLSPYKIELNKVLNKSKEANFYRLRMSYTDTEEYTPYTFDQEIVKEAFIFLKNKKYKNCLEASNKILTKEYVNIDGHYLSSICNFKLGLKEKEKYHKYVLEGLINSIKNNGDGKTINTAYTTISTHELYSYLSIYRLRAIDQSLKHDNYKVYDVMKVVNDQQEEFILYFNITKQMSKIQKLLKKNK